LIYCSQGLPYYQGSPFSLESKEIIWDADKIRWTRMKTFKKEFLMRERGKTQHFGEYLQCV